MCHQRTGQDVQDAEAARLAFTRVILMYEVGASGERKTKSSAEPLAQRYLVPMPATGPAVTTAPRDAEGTPWGTSEEDTIVSQDRARARVEALGTLPGSSRDLLLQPPDTRATPKLDVPIVEEDDLTKSGEQEVSAHPQRPRRTPTRYADAE